jgi:superoxide dismutase, Cu-Zn family
MTTRSTLPSKRIAHKPLIYILPFSPALLFILSALFVAGCNSANRQSDQEKESNADNDIATAKAIMEASSGSNVTGQATFTAERGKVRFEFSVQNLSPGPHGVHLHEKGDCSAADASSAGGHWNPTMKPHGRRGEGTAYHKGDVGNMEVGEDGKGTLNLLVEGWTIGGADSTDILGKSVIIHEKADDFESQPAGNAGSRISCGVIKQD